MTDADLAVRITALKQAVSKAKAAIEQRRQEADALSKEMAVQSADNAKLQAELDKLQAVAEFDAHWQRVCSRHVYATPRVVRQRPKSALPLKADMCAHAAMSALGHKRTSRSLALKLSRRNGHAAFRTVCWSRLMRVSIRQLRIPFGPASTWREVEDRPQRGDIGRIARVLTRVGHFFGHLTRPEKP